MEETIELKEQWTLSFTHPETAQAHRITATVPGNVEIDLIREGLIVDCMPPDNPNAMHAWELIDWTYETSFDTPALRNGENIFLELGGVDTIADVVLNGENILRCENMFIPHTVDVSGKLKPAGNTLTVHIHSAERYARQFNYDASIATIEHHESCSHLRKARHMWGWDNAPRLISAGLWRPARLVIKQAIRFDDVYLYTKVLNEKSAVIGVDWKISTSDTDLTGYRGKIMVTLNGLRVKEYEFAIEQTFGRSNISIPDPHLWWPRGYGAAVLYDVNICLLKDGVELAPWNGKLGIRKIELLRTETTSVQKPGEFVFLCNGEKIFIRGTNWKPLDALHSRARERMAKALDLCVDVNCNMVRVWGGGVYEDHDFFDYCDAQGLMVWQDFMFACEFPPLDDTFQKQVATEAEIIIKRLRNHASLALWCGDNENDMAFFWGTFLPPALLPSHNAISRSVLKNAVLRLDPYRSYLESSPYISDDVATGRFDKNGMDRMQQFAPEQHIYAANFRQTYRSSAAHFVSETGPINYNAVSDSADIVAREMPRVERLWDEAADRAPADMRHQTDGYFLKWKSSLQQNIMQFFGCEFDIADWGGFTQAANLMAADTFKFAIEHFRMRTWRKTGVIWWSLLDMWPMLFNYSVVDYHFRKKYPYYWIRQSQQPFCLMIDEDTGRGLRLFAANDTLSDVPGTYRIRSISVKAKERTIAAGRFTATKNGSTFLRDMGHMKERSLLVLEWDTGNGLSYNHFVTGEPPYDIAVYRTWCAALDALYHVRSEVMST